MTIATASATKCCKIQQVTRVNTKGESKQGQHAAKQEEPTSAARVDRHFECTRPSEEQSISLACNATDLLRPEPLSAPLVSHSIAHKENIQEAGTSRDPSLHVRESGTS